MDSPYHFDRPPVVETVLGVQFDPLPKFTNAHLGAYWKWLGNGWPTSDIAPVIAAQFETFGEARAWQPSVQLTNSLDCRIRIRNKQQDKMVQVQKDRFHYNWLGERGGKYPRYRTVRPQFDEAVARFKNFLSEEQLGELTPNQWEVTYVNHIPKDTVWKDPLDCSKLFRGCRPFPAVSSGTQPETFAGEWHFEIEPKQGRLHVRLQHAVKREEDETEGYEIIRMTLTARGPIDTEQGLSLGVGLDLGREVIVRAFHDMTSDEAHDYWGKIG